MIKFWFKPCMVFIFVDLFRSSNSTKEKLKSLKLLTLNWRKRSENKSEIPKPTSGYKCFQSFSHPEKSKNNFCGQGNYYQVVWKLTKCCADFIDSFDIIRYLFWRVDVYIRIYFLSDARQTWMLYWIYRHRLGYPYREQLHIKRPSSIKLYLWMYHILL